MYLPRQLQKPPDRRRRFLSKISVERYIKSKFPAANIDAFFYLFHLEGPCKKEFMDKISY
jgi:hypothetical protein